MAAQSKTETVTDPVVAFLAQCEGEARLVLSNLGEQVVSLTEGAKSLATIMVAARSHISRSITSKKSGKAVTVPDWDGRSPLYREWFRDTLTPMIEEYIPSGFRSSILNAVRNHVQALVKEQASRTELQHLGMSLTEKRKAASARKADERPSEGASTSDAIAADDALKAATPRMIAEGLKRLALALSETPADKLSAGDRKAIDTLTKDTISVLMTYRGKIGAVQAVTPSKAKASA